MTTARSRDSAALFQKLIGVVNREAAGQSTMFMYESGLTFPQIIVLYALLWEGPKTISALAETLRLSLAATSQLVDRLVEGKYVAREEDANDRRIRRVRLRPHGKQFMDRLDEIRHREVSAAFERISPRLRGRLTNVLEEVISSMDRARSRT